MKKKGTTESYSAFIGIVIAFLMLTAIGCAIYNMYKPRGTEYFDKLVSLLKDMEEKGIDEEGEIPFYVEEDQVLIGFGKKQEYIGRKGVTSVFNWKCYGINFGWGVFTPLGLTGSIDRPKDKCPEGKSCLCLCKMSFVDEVKQDACTGSGVKCKAFDKLGFLGGEGCAQGVFIPGTEYNLVEGGHPRGLSILFYKKIGDIVSIDGKAAKTEEEIKKLISSDKEKAEKQAKVVVSTPAGKENSPLVDELSTKLSENPELNAVMLYSQKGEGVTPEQTKEMVQEIKTVYTNSKYFLQLKTDNTLGNSVIVNHIEGSKSSSKLAKEVSEKLREEGFETTEGTSEDSALQDIASIKTVLEIKISQDNTKALEMIVEAVTNYEEKPEQIGGVLIIPPYGLGTRFTTNDEQVAQGLKEQIMSDWNIDSAVLYPKLEEKNPLTEQADQALEEWDVALKVQSVETDLTQKEGYPVVINHAEGSETSEKLADLTAEFMVEEGFEVERGTTTDPILKDLADTKTILEVKTLSTDPQIAEVINKAVQKDKEEHEETGGALISASYEEENSVLIEKLKEKIMSTWDQTTETVYYPIEEWDRITPEEFVNNIETGYKNKTYFVQIETSETDLTQKEGYPVVINYAEGSETSEKLAKTVVEQLKGQEIEAIVGLTQDKELKEFPKDNAVLELKVPEDNIKALVAVSDAIAKYKHEEAMGQPEVVIVPPYEPSDYWITEEVKESVTYESDMPSEIADLEAIKEEGKSSPKALAEEISRDYRDADYFLQFETDASITSPDVLKIVYNKNSPDSQEFAQTVSKELELYKMKPKLEESTDPLLASLGIPNSVKVKMPSDPKDMTRVSKSISDAISKTKGVAKKECEPGKTYPDFSCLLTDNEFSSLCMATPEEIRKHLEKRKSMLLQEYEKTGKTYWDYIYEASKQKNLNPILVLATLQKEHSLVYKQNLNDVIDKNTGKTAKQALDVAFGCDARGKGHVVTEEFKGFDNQVKCAVQTLRKHYDITPKLPTKMDLNEGKIKGQVIKNKATYSLYKYTPYLYDPEILKITKKEAGGNMLLFQVYTGMKESILPAGEGEKEQIICYIEPRPGETTKPTIAFVGLNPLSSENMDPSKKTPGDKGYDPFNFPGFEGYNEDFYPGRCGSIHRGIDIYANKNGVPVRAIANGTIFKIASCTYLVHEIGGKEYTSAYCHVKGDTNLLNKQVKQGDKIGVVDYPNIPHVHLEVYEGKVYDAGTTSKYTEGSKGCEIRTVDAQLIDPAIIMTA